MALESDWTLPCLNAGDRSIASVGLTRGSSETFSRYTATLDLANSAGPVHRALDDGAIYLRWNGHFEFLIAADGSRIACRSLRNVSPEIFDSYLLGPALSFALLKQGVEPLHATTVVVNGKAVGLLGACGHGKSSLAAWFIAQGHRLLTDDLLVVSEHGQQLVAHPGPPRIKLFPEVAERLLGTCTGETLGSPFASKLVVTLDSRQSCDRATGLEHLYVLGTPGTSRSRVTVTTLSPRRGFVELVRNTFNTLVTDPRRLAQQLSYCVAVASRVPIKRVSYPRRWNRLAAVHDAILEDIQRSS